MKKRIIRPLKGIDVDSSLNRRDDNTLYMAKNLRINDLNNAVIGEYTNIKGPNKIISAASGEKILKVHKIKDNIVLFMIQNNVYNPNVIALIKESDIPKYGESPIVLDLTYYYWQTMPAGNVIIKGDFGFDADEKIYVKSYYEDDNTQKIYWTTKDEPLRALNIIYSTNNIISSYTPESLEASPSADLSIPFIANTISGNLSTGKIYYAYTLVNNTGAETNLSELSYPYHLTKSSENESNDYNYKGYGIDVNSSKGVSVEISDIPSEFSRLKLYSIHYIDDVSLPVVNLVYDDAASGSITINDTGTSLMTISTEEFLSINNLATKNGVLEIKNNRLFISNYKEEYFDIDDYAVDNYWDARAYRYDSSQNCWLKTAENYPNNTGGLNFSSSALTSSTVPANHDCINVSNDITNPSAGETHQTYIYRANGTTIGAEGLNIAITPSQGNFNTPDDSEESIKWSSKKGNFWNTFDSYASPYYNGNAKTFKLEEVYRLAIQFKNSKGQLSYPKWICDYKFNFIENNYTPIDYGSNILEMKIYILLIEASNIPNDPETGSPFEWRILYTDITDQDKSVDWGTFINLKKLTGVSEYRANMLKESNFTTTPNGDTKIDVDSEASGNKYVEFVNPDYCVGKINNYTRIKGFMDIPYTSVAGGYSYSYKSNIFKAYDFSANAGLAALTTVSNQYNIEYNIDMESQVSLTSSDKFNRNGETVVGTGNAYYYKTGTGAIMYGNSNKGRCQILEASSFGEINKMIFGCAYIDNAESRYGGFSYTSRKNNGYVPLSEFNDDTSYYVYGDSTCGVFEYLRQISDNDSPYIVNNQDFENNGKKILTDPEYLPGSNEIIMFPYISKLNMKLRSDDYFTKLYTTPGSYMLHEFSGVYQDVIGGSDWEGEYVINTDKDILTQSTDLYLYNHTYTREQDLLKYYEKPISVNFITEFKNRIISSNQKILGELSDSFLKIDTGTYIDVDGQYGEIRNLIIFNDRLYFFQDKAIGTVSVNEKSTTIDSNGSEIIIGETGVLSRYDYLTTTNGISDANHVIKAGNALYLIDSIKKEFLKITNSIEKISITKNINSLVKDSSFEESIIVYNRKYNEILFFYKDDSALLSQNALVFNELTQSFIGIQNHFGSIISSVEVDREDLFDEIIIDNSYNMHVLNDGDYNKFNSSYNESEITFLVPSKSENFVLYTNIEMILKQVDSVGDAVNFIDTIRIYNNECDTGELDFATSTKEKFGKFRTNKLRNYTGSNERMLSDHIYITLKTTDNDSTNYRVFIRDLITSFSEYNFFA